MIMVNLLPETKMEDNVVVVKIMAAKVVIRGATAAEPLVAVIAGAGHSAVVAILPIVVA